VDSGFVEERKREFVDLGEGKFGEMDQVYLRTSSMVVVPR
jgi:hypothetical protein